MAFEEHDRLAKVGRFAGVVGVAQKNLHERGDRRISNAQLKRIDLSRKVFQRTNRGYDAAAGT